MNADRVRMWAACRPILGLVVRGRPVLFPPTFFYVVRHPRFGLYVRRPYDLTGDPRRDWGKFQQAFKFSSEMVAVDVCADLGGTVERYELHRY